MFAVVHMAPGIGQSNWVPIWQMAAASVLASTILSVVGLPVLRRLNTRSKEIALKRDQDWALLDGYKTPDGTIMPPLGERVSKLEKESRDAVATIKYQTTLIEQMAKKMNGAGQPPTFNTMSAELKTLALNQESFHNTVSSQISAQNKTLEAISRRLDALPPK